MKSVKSIEMICLVMLLHVMAVQLHGLVGSTQLLSSDSGSSSWVVLTRRSTAASLAVVVVVVVVAVAMESNKVIR